MSPVKRRRQLPTLINRGLGLLEVILPRGSSDDGETVLPPGQRDASGFWFPAGYSEPAEIFSAIQRQLQANQRRIQKRRVATRMSPPGPAAEPVPTEPAAAFGTPEEVAVPLPKLLSDALPSRSTNPMSPSSSRVASKAGPPFRSSLEGALLPEPD